MRKVAHVCTSGISHKILGDKLTLLHQAGYDVTFISSGDGLNETIREGYPFQWRDIPMSRTIRPLRDLKSIWQMRKLFKRERYDIVHTHTAKAGLIGRVAAKLAGVPTIIHTSHGLPFYEGQARGPHTIYKLLERAAARFCDALASQNREDIAALQRLAPWRSVYFEGNGVDLAKLDKAASNALARLNAKDLKRAYGIREDVPLLLMAARFEPVKDHALLLDAISQAKQAGKLCWVTALAGQGPLEQEVRKRIEEEGLEDDIVLIGQQSPLVPWLLIADAVTLTSEKEGIPRSLMEAMAYGKPVVATDVLGTRELVVSIGREANAGGADFATAVDAANAVNAVNATNAANAANTANTANAANAANTSASAVSVAIPAVAAKLAAAGSLGASQPEATGELVPYRDASALFEALHRMMSDQELRIALGAAGRRRIESQFTESLVVERIGAIYSETAARKARAGSRFGAGRRFVKRAVDLLVSIPAVLLLLPVIAATALAVRLRLGSPVLFRQQRPGRYGNPFVLFKFRTMTSGKDSQGNELPDELRLTSFGKLLRKLSLDELPQLLNVIRGEMSLIGPRPLLMEYMDLYTPEQARRHEVRPGITGWAQINGRNALTWEDKFRLDVWYVDHQSLWLDCRIALMTVIKVVKREGIQQEGQATVRKFAGSRNAERAI